MFDFVFNDTQIENGRKRADKAFFQSFFGFVTNFLSIKVPVVGYIKDIETAVKNGWEE